MCELTYSLPAAIIVANAGFMNCVKHMGVRVQFVSRVLREVCRVIHPSYELRSEARPSPTVTAYHTSPCENAKMKAQ